MTDPHQTEDPRPQPTPEPELEDGDLPSGWVEVSLLEIADLVRGVTYTKNVVSDIAFEGLLPVLRANNITGNGISLSGLVYVPKKLISDAQKIRADDIIVATSSGSISVVGKAARAKHDLEAGFGAFCVLIRPNFNVNSRYVGHYFSSRDYRDYVSSVARGVNINNLKREHFEAISFPLPPLPEQIRIADKLDTLLAGVEAGRERLARMPALLSRLRQSILSAAISGELTREWRESQYSYEVLSPEIMRQERKRVWESQQLASKRKGIYKKPLEVEGLENESLPGSWSVVSIDEMTEFVTDGEHATPKRTDEGILLLSARNVIDGHLRLDKVDYISEETYEGLSKRVLPQVGDVLLSCSGTVGRSCVVPENIRFSLVRSVAIMRPLLRMGTWLSYVLRSPQLQVLMEDRKTETAQANLFQGKIKVLPIPLPPLPEQAEIVRRVELLFARVDALERQTQAVAKAYDLLTPALLQKAFRGELVPQDPNDEPASALLEHIRATRGAVTTGTGKRGRKAGKPKDAAQASEVAEPKRRGRPRKASTQVQVGSIPTVSSFEDAVRQLEAQGKERTEGTRQGGLFGDE